MPANPTAAHAAELVKSWLRDSGVKSPPTEITSFITDLETGNGLHGWAGADYSRMLPLRYKNSVLVRGATILRNLLVFAPIALTWFSLMTVSGQFASAVAALRAGGPSEESLNFLDYWQNVAGFHQFSNIARWDVTLILALVVLTAYVGLSENFSRRNHRLEQQHADMMTALERALNSYRYLTVADLNTVLQGTLQSLNDSSTSIATAAAALEASSESAFQAVSNVHTFTASTFQPLLGQLQTTVDSLGAAAHAHQDMTDLVTNNRAQLAQQLDATRAGFDAIVRNIDAESRRLTQAVQTELQQATSGIKDAAHVVATQLASQTVTELASVSASLRSAADALGSAMGSSTGAITETAENLKSAVASIEFGLQQIRDDLENVGRRLGAR